MSKNVLHVTKYYKPVDRDEALLPEIFINAFKDNLNNKQKVFCYNVDDKIIKETISDVPVLRVGGTLNLDGEQISYDYQYELDHLIKMDEPDTVYLYYPNYYGAKNLLKFLPASTKLILVIGKRYKNFASFIYKRTEKAIFKRADIIISVSDKNDYKLNDILKSKLVKMDIGYEARLTSNFENVDIIHKSINKKHMLYLNLSKEKKPSIKCFLNSLKLLSKDYLVYVTGNDEQLLNFDKLINNKFRYLKSQIKTIPNVSKQQDLDYIAASSCYINLDKDNKSDMGYSLLRVMNESTPIISFQGGINVSGETGLVIKPKSKVLAKSIKKLCEDSVYNYEMSISTKNYFDDNYNKKNFLNQLINLNI